MPTILTGELSSFSLPSMLQVMEWEESSGWLSIGSAGRIGLSEGQVVAAEASGRTGMEALRELFLAQEGSFTLSDDEQPSGAVLGDTTGLVMDAVRIVDEWGRLAPMILGAASSLDRFSLADATRKLVSQLDGQRTVAEAVALAGVTRPEIVDPVLELLDDASLEEVAAPDPERANVAMKSYDDIDFYELLDQARVAMRQQRFSEAEAMIRAALRQEPEHRIALQNLKHLDKVRHNAKTLRGRWGKRPGQS